MKYYLLAGALLAALSLFACGGGGSSGGITPPSSTPTRNTVSFGVTEIGTASLARRSASLTSQAACSSVPQYAVAEATDPTVTPPTNSGSTWVMGGAMFAATEYDANCKVVSTTPAWSSARGVAMNPIAIAGIPAATPPSGQALAVPSTPGLASITATFSDGTIATQQIHAYAPMIVTCDLWWQGGIGWNDQTGYPIQVNNDCNGQITYNTPAPVDVYANGNGQVVFPYGYEVVSQSSSWSISNLATMTSCSTFSSQGTNLNMASLASSYIILFKTADGKCVKFASGGANGSGIVGLYALSDASGNFAY